MGVFVCVAEEEGCPTRFLTRIYRVTKQGSWLQHQKARLCVNLERGEGMGQSFWNDGQLLMMIDKETWSTQILKLVHHLPSICDDLVLQARSFPQQRIPI